MLVTPVSSKVFANSYQKKAQKSNIQTLNTQTQNPLVPISFADIAPYFGANKAISFAAVIQLPNTGRVLYLLEAADQYGKKIKTEASKRLKGEYPWPIKPGETLVPWMLTAETSTFMKVGGLGQIGSDMPKAFNERFESKPDIMPIVTPLYENNDPAKGEKTGKIEYKQGNQYTYTGDGGKVKIDLKKVKKLKVLVYENKRLQNKNVDVLVGKLDNTPYVFLKNDEYFNIKPDDKNPAIKEGPYVINKNQIDETERFAFFSKAVYELMKARNKEEIQGVPKPNIVIANDWHAGAVSSLARHKGLIEQEKEIKNMPVIHIVHNLQYQGWDYENTGKILNTLFEGTAKDVVTRDNSLYIRGTYNSAGAGLNLADRVVAVSPYYKDEMLRTDILSHDFKTLLGIRNNHDTFVGITNGYDRASLEPSEKFVDKVNNEFNLHEKEAFKPYSLDMKSMTDEERKQVKKENKQKFINLLKGIVKGDKTVVNVKLYKAKAETGSGALNWSRLNAEKTPIIVSVGRFVNQKGYDLFADSLEKLAEKTKKQKKPFPLVVILGSGDKYPEEKLIKMKDNLAKRNPEASKKVFLFKGFSPPLRNAMLLGGDFFAIPSKFEPCGLTQMESMPVGCVPIAAATGGLVTTIDDGKDGFLTKEFYSLKEEEIYKKNNDQSLATDEKGKPILDEVKPIGFYKIRGVEGKKEPKDAKEAYNKNVEIFAATMQKAIDKFNTAPKSFRKMQLNAMQKDFSWNKENGSMDAYIELIKTGKVSKIKGITA